MNGSLEKKLAAVLAESTGERPMHAFLKQHDYLVGLAFKTSTHAKGVFPEFRLGSEFRADFVAVSRCSGWYDVNFIELESPGEKLYLKNGTPSKALRVAERQISDWKEWKGRSEKLLRGSLVDLFERNKVHSTGAFVGIYDAAQELQTDNCLLNCRYWIVIGRRERLRDADNRRRGIQLLESDIGICTYDRLVDAAQRYDKTDRIQKAEIRHRKG